MLTWNPIDRRFKDVLKHFKKPKFCVCTVLAYLNSNFAIKGCVCVDYYYAIDRIELNLINTQIYMKEKAMNANKIVGEW